MQLSILTERFRDFSYLLEEQKLSAKHADIFQKHVLQFYHEHGRKFSWRETRDPYHIVVSEIMLQQTQTERVKLKFEEFIVAFPSLSHLADTNTHEVIVAWQGLGYNRRALALHTFARDVMQQYNGLIPQEPELLQKFKGIGPNTAGSICAFAFNKPTIFIETNIRTVYIHSFFHQQHDIHDAQLIPLIEATLDKNNAREWYYALMDYGVALKKAFPNPSRKSKHYARQSKFEGSERQIRGMILRALTTHKALTFDLLCMTIEREPQRIERNLHDLIQEGFIQQINGYYLLRS